MMMLFAKQCGKLPLEAQVPSEHSDLDRALI